MENIMKHHQMGMRVCASVMRFVYLTVALLFMFGASKILAAVVVTALVLLALSFGLGFWVRGLIPTSIAER